MVGLPTEPSADMHIPSRPSEDKAYRVVQEDTIVSWTHEGVTYRTTIPEGFEYKPGLAVRIGLLGVLDIFAPTYAVESASALHDYLYNQHGKNENFENMPRAVADAAMLSDKDDPRWVARVAWGVVRMLGWLFW